MDLTDLVEIVPKLLLLFIPGYIVVNIKRVFCQEKKKDNFDVTLYSILYSFIVRILLTTIKAMLYQLGSITSLAGKTDGSPHLAASCVQKIASLLENGVVNQASCLVLSVILGYFLVKIHHSKIGVWITHCFNKDVLPHSTVWGQVLKREKGAWATVYLKNGLIYTGQLIDYTADPDDSNKELHLEQFRLMVRTEGTLKDPKKFSLTIEDRTSEEGTSVLLRGEEISSIEIVP